MKREEVRVVYAEQGDITYLLTRKKVKNMNLRIDKTGQVKVSAPSWVRASVIDDFVREKQDFIWAARERIMQRVSRQEKKPSLTPKEKEQCRIMLEEVCQRIYPLVEPYGVEYPAISFRTMTSRWGSCQPIKKKITLNYHLRECKMEAIEYVVLHEFAHFIHPNHSRQFYDFIMQFMPDWKERRNMLKEML